MASERDAIVNWLRAKAQENARFRRPKANWYWLQSLASAIERGDHLPEDQP